MAYIAPVYERAAEQIRSEQHDAQEYFFQMFALVLGLLVGVDEHGDSESVTWLIGRARLLMKEMSELHVQALGVDQACKMTAERVSQLMGDDVAPNDLRDLFEPAKPKH